MWANSSTSLRACYPKYRSAVVLDRSNIRTGFFIRTPPSHSDRPFRLFIDCRSTRPYLSGYFFNSDDSNGAWSSSSARLRSFPASNHALRFRRHLPWPAPHQVRLQWASVQFSLEKAILILPWIKSAQRQRYEHHDQRHPAREHPGSV